MRIALINHYAGSPHYGMEYRPYYLAQEWAGHGHQVYILAASFSHVRRINPGAALRQEEIDGIHYRWIPTSSYGRNGMKRFANMLQFVFRLHQVAPTLAASLRPDVVIASSTYPLDIIAACKLSRLAKARLIFEIHDLWPLSPIEIGGMSRWNPFILLMRWAEGRALRQADRVVSMLPLTKEYLVSRGMAAEKFNYIPNGLSLSEWGGQTLTLDLKISEQIRQIRAKFPFLIGYAGSHGPANALGVFVDAAPMLRRHGIALVLLGHGPEKAALMEKCREKCWDNVFFLDPIPKKQIPPFLAEIDAAYIGLKSLNLFKYGVSPNKIFDYMMAERPVICAINCPVNLVDEAQCGVSVRSESPQALAEACLMLRDLPEEKRRQMGKNGKEYVLKKHDYRLLASQFEQVMIN